VYVTNNDGFSCSNSSFTLSAQVPNGWTYELADTQLILPPSGNRAIDLFVTPPNNSNYNNQTVPVGVYLQNLNSGQTATWTSAYTVIPIEPQPMTFRVKFDGVNGGEADGAKISVRFYLTNGSILDFSAPLIVRHVGSGIYQANSTLLNPLPVNTGFSVGVKGEKHLRLRFCSFFGQTAPCLDGQTLSYSVAQPISFDFTGRPLPAGDLNRDNQINPTDIKLVTDIFKKPSSQLTPSDIATADLNYDGYVDNFDLNLILQSLSTRYDE